jgi:hypothetical protein
MSDVNVAAPSIVVPPPEKAENKPATKEAIVKTRKKEVKAKVPKTSKAAKSAKRKPGPAMAAFKQKKERRLGVCNLIGCAQKTVTAKSKWCKEHKKEIRKAQLAANNIIWRKRVEAGTAGHHVAYRNHATVWAQENAKKALSLVKSGKSVIEDPKKFEEILKKDAARLAAQEAKRAVRTQKAAKRSAA